LCGTDGEYCNNINYKDKPFTYKVETPGVYKEYVIKNILSSRGFPAFIIRSIDFFGIGQPKQISKCTSFSESIFVYLTLIMVVNGSE
jgi:hypothetical protein